MESSEQCDGLNAANRPRGPADRCILAKREVGPDLIVIVGMGLQHIPEMPFAQNRPIGESDSICGRHNPFIKLKKLAGIGELLKNASRIHLG